MRVEAPPIYPSEAVVDIQREAHRLGRELLSRLGYHVPKRMRKSTLESIAKELRISKSKLDPRETGDIAEDMYGQGSAQDPKLRAKVKDQRHRLRQRLDR